MSNEDAFNESMRKFAEGIEKALNEFGRELETLREELEAADVLPPEAGDISTSDGLGA